MRHLGIVHGVELALLHQEMKRNYMRGGLIGTKEMAADIHTKSYGEKRRPEWAAVRRLINVLSPSEVRSVVGSEGHGWRNRHDNPHLYETADVCTSSDDEPSPTKGPQQAEPQENAIAKDRRESRKQRKKNNSKNADEQTTPHEQGPGIKSDPGRGAPVPEPTPWSKPTPMPKLNQLRHRRPTIP